MDFGKNLATQFEEIVSSSAIDGYIRQKLECIRSDQDLTTFFRRFALYNLAFPGGVAMLAGAFHMRPDIFQDKQESFIDNMDRSSEIASHIIFAAEDEFATSNRKIRVTHRMMAQEMVKFAKGFSNLSDDAFAESFSELTDYQEQALAIRNGYRVYSLENERDMFLALGFHLASERLADIEFNALSDILSRNFPAFVKAARQVSGPQSIRIYGWIATHTTVEVDHYAYSLRAAEMALEFYTGEMHTKQELYGLILDGFHEFIQHQRNMFEWLQ
jgi:hypothetical protein